MERVVSWSMEFRVFTLRVSHVYERAKSRAIVP